MSYADCIVAAPGTLLWVFHFSPLLALTYGTYKVILVVLPLKSHHNNSKPTEALLQACLSKI
jgi:hypothetical protein